MRRPSRVPPPIRASTDLLLRAAYLLRGLLAATVLTAFTSGIPWALVHYIGWPLPSDLPSWAEIEATLLAPMTTSFLLDVLGCALWPVWAAFLIEVARAVRREVRVPRPALPRPGPLHAVAALLVGMIIVALLSQRSVVPSPAVGIETVSIVDAPIRLPSAGVGSPRVAGDPAEPRRAGRPTTVEVRPPRDGVHDSLWRIAERALGDGNRWPEIYALNRGRHQQGGGTLTRPDLIRPGWTLRLPTEHSAPGSHHSGHGGSTGPAPEPRPSSTTHTNEPSPSPSTGTSTTPANSSPPSSPAPVRHPHGRPGIGLFTGAFVSVGLAGLIAAVLLIVRRRRRVAYRPGSGDRDDLALAPVIRALRLAEGTGSETSTELLAPLTQVAPSRQRRVIGVTDGQALAWDLARTRGLGLTGPGALGAVRALLITMLAEAPQPAPAANPVELLIPASDADLLFGERGGGSAHLNIVDDLDAALDRMERELLTRTRSRMNVLSTTDEAEPPPTDLVLIATPDPRTAARLQAILDNGSTFGIAGILLGPWRPGATARVGPDGTVLDTSLPTEDGLIGCRLFTLPTRDARVLLDLLFEAQPETSPSSSPPSGAMPEEPSPATVTGPPSPSGADGPVHSNSALAPHPRRTHGVSNGQGPVRPKPLHLAVLGDVRLTHHQSDGHEHADLSNALTPKQREILAYLALHRDGARRETLVAAIWPEAPQQRPYNSFHATVSQLRRALRTASHDTFGDVTVHDDGRYFLDASLVTVDLWHVTDTLAASRQGASELDYRTSVERAVDLYSGDFATDITAEWAEEPREALRRDVLDAVSGLVRLLRDGEPERALVLLERVRRIDPHNEAIYRDIARFQAHLGRHDAVPRTLHLLTTTLAGIDEQPSRETRALFVALQRREAEGWGSNSGGSR